MFQWLKRIVPQVFFVVDDRGVQRLVDGRIVEQVAWDDLEGVDIITTDEGPRREDVFFVLHGKDGNGVVVPQETAVPKKLLERLQDLPGFDGGAALAPFPPFGGTTWAAAPWCFLSSFLWCSSGGRRSSSTILWSSSRFINGGGSTPACRIDMWKNKSLKRDSMRSFAHFRRSLIFSRPQ